MPQDVLAQLLRRIADLERRVASVVRIGRVAEVQDRPYRAIINIGSEDRPVLTPPLHVLVPRAGSSLVDFSPLDVGEGVLVLAPGGSDSVMFALPSLARGRIELIAPPSDARYISGDLVVGGDVKAGANVSLGRVLDGGVSLERHVHGAGQGPGRYKAPPTGGFLLGRSGPPVELL